jgi:hypothetical protein
MAYNIWTTQAGRWRSARQFWNGRALASFGGVATVMEKRGGIRLSAMEIALLVILLGSLALGLLQAWQQEQMERMLDTDHEQ